jgi:hypothetical protein
MLASARARTRRTALLRRLDLLGWFAALALTAAACAKDEANGPITGPADAASLQADARDAGEAAPPDGSVMPEAEAPVDAALPDIVDPRGDRAISTCSDFDPNARTYTPPGSTHPHCYWWHASGLSWANAESSCEFDRGHLVTIQSAAEQAFVTGSVYMPDAGGRNTVAWIGLTDGEALSSPTVGRPFTWITGEVYTYTQWAVLESGPEPSNTCSPCGDETLCCQHRGALRARDGMWQDREDYNSYPYICEATLEAVTLDAGPDASDDGGEAPDGGDASPD